VALAVNGTFSYLGADVLGSADVALDATGNAQAATLYGPYGGTRYSSGTMPTDYGFTGQHSDSTTGLDYYVARYYDPLAGQFTSPDTTLPGDGYDLWGLSRYAYVEGNPTTRTDPSGHCPFCIGFVVGAIVGAAISYGTQVYNNYQSGNPNPWTDVNLAQIGESALVGGVIGATGGAAGAAVASALEGSSALVAIGGGAVAGAAIGAGEGAAGQIGDNLIHGRHWSDDVGQAALIGAVTGGIGGGAGAALSRYGGRILRAGARLLGRACSFSPDTAVATPSGEQPIGSLKVGDQVTAYDPASGKTSTQTVQHVWINHDTDLIDLTLHTDTPAHPTQDLRKTRAVLAGEPLGRAPPQQQQQTSSTSQSQGRDEVVHTNAKHPWLTAERGWVTAGQLTMGMHVVREDGTTAVVARKRVVPGAAAMWNLTVSTFHTFAVGAGQYVVHNCGEQVEYGSTPLSRAVQAARRAANNGKGDWLHNYAAGEPEDGGALIIGRSAGKGAAGIHAEEDVLAKAGQRRLRALYSEYEPCASKCAAKVAGIPNVTYSWPFNGDTPDETDAIRAASRILREDAINALRGLS
jgi:RHS repeat-associated protein